MTVLVQRTGTSPATVISASLMPVVSVAFILSVAVPAVWAAVAALVIGLVATVLGVTGLVDRYHRNRSLAAAATFANGVLSLSVLTLLALTGWLT